MAGIPDIREWLIDDLKDLENKSSSHNWGWDFSDGVESIADDLIKKAKKEFKWLHESSTKEESVEDNIYDMITDAADALDALDDDLKDDASDSIDKAIEDGETAKDGLSEDVTTGATNPSDVGQHKVDSIDLVEDGEMKLYKYQGPIYRRDNGTQVSDSETLYTKATSEKKAYNNLSFRLKKKGQELAGHEYMSIEEKKESDQVHSDEFQFTCPVCKEKFTSNEKFSKCPGCQSKLRINDVGGTEEVVD
jgi:rubrerythrin